MSRNSKLALNRYRRSIAAWLPVLACALVPFSLVAENPAAIWGQGIPATNARRGVTVADVIEMTQIVTLDDDPLASFSPDGTRVIVVVKKGNLFMSIAARTGRKEIGDTINDRDAMAGTRGCYRTDQFVEQ